MKQSILDSYEMDVDNKYIEGNHLHICLLHALSAVWVQYFQEDGNLHTFFSLLKHKNIKKALNILPDEEVTNFTEWFLGRSPEELQVAIHRARMHSDDFTGFFNSLGRYLLSDDEAHQMGAVFTPHWLTANLTHKAIQYWKEFNPDKSAPELVGDVSCGTGAFLLELDNSLPQVSRIVGIDKSPALACLAALSLAGRQNYLVEAKDTLLDKSKQVNLFSSSFDMDVEQVKYDILVGNPPYIRSQSLSHEYSSQLKRVYTPFTNGNFDLVVLFLAHTLETLAPNGVASLIVSNKFMSSRYGTAICRRLAEKVRILEIMNFGDGQVFPDYTTYTCTITFANVSKAKTFSVVSFPPGLTWQENNVHLEHAQENKLPDERLLSHPWNLASEARSEIREYMSQQKFPGILDIFHTISQGVRTGANQVFLIHQDVASHLEPELLYPYINGQNIRRCHILPTSQYMLYPYHLNAHQMVEVIPSKVMEKDFPKTWSYLLSHHKALQERDLDSNLLWYGYSRTQNLEVQHRPKILMKEMMSRAEFAADTTGAFAVSSGYALVARPNMSKEELRLWAAVLSTPTMEFQLRQLGTQLHSGWFRLLGHHLKSIKLPIFQEQDLKIAYAISSKLHDNSNDQYLWNDLDSLVASCFQLNMKMREEIADFLQKAHAISQPNSSPSITTQLYYESNEKKASSSTAYPELSEEQRHLYLPVELPQFNELHRQRDDLKHLVTFAPNKTKSISRWYSYTQGYSEQLVKNLLEELDVKRTDVVYDPFVGSGTTLLTCRMQGIASFGQEISPLMAWITTMKVTPQQPEELRKALCKVKHAQPGRASTQGLLFLDYLNQAYSSAILEQLVGWRNWITDFTNDTSLRDFLLLGLMCILEKVSHIRKHGSHYRFLNKEKGAGLEKLNISLLAADTDITPIFIEQLENMIVDVERKRFYTPLAPCEVFIGDARQMFTESKEADVVITSPPYLNRNNYIAQQKAELSLLNALPSYEAYKQLVQSTFRSHVESNLTAQPQTTIPEIEEILQAFELTENNNPKIPSMIAGYFEDMKDTLDVLWHVVKPGGRLAFVVGNCRWGGVVVPLDHLLVLIAQRKGFVIERILVTRMKGNSPQQMKRYGRIPVRESIVIFRKPL